MTAPTLFGSAIAPAIASVIAPVIAPAVVQLGYLGFEVSDPAAWERFATQVLGLTVASRSDGGAFTLRMDARRHRFMISPGAADDLAFMGWQVDDEAALESLAARLREAGITVADGSEVEAAARGVRRLKRLRDPAGVPLELFCDPALSETPFVSPLVKTGFVADALGLGHAVITSHDLAESRAFYLDLLGLRLSDHIIADIHGHHVEIAFLHANRRHHSLAVGHGARKRIHHFMIEVRSIDEVGLAMDRTLASGLRIMQTLGRHPNDRMLSFYARTPSGFQFECGFGGREIDDADFTPTTYDHISEWGHQAPQVLMPPVKGKP